MQQLVHNLVSNGIISNTRVEHAMKLVDRKNYVESTVKEKAYLDAPLPIGFQATISAPHMVLNYLLACLCPGILGRQAERGFIRFGCGIRLWVLVGLLCTASRSQRESNWLGTHTRAIKV